MSVHCTVVVVVCVCVLLSFAIVQQQPRQTAAAGLSGLCSPYPTPLPLPSPSYPTTTTTLPIPSLVFPFKLFCYCHCEVLPTLPAPGRPVRAQGTASGHAAPLQRQDTQHRGDAITCSALALTARTRCSRSVLASSCPCWASSYCSRHDSLPAWGAGAHAPGGERGSCQV